MPSNPDLIKACVLWDKITEKMNKGEYKMPSSLNHLANGKPYSSGDFTPLSCRIDGEKAELTVGSAAGHKVHVDLKDGKLNYYDTDRDPNSVIKDLLEDEGLKCRIESDGVKCEGVTKKNVQSAFKVLAMPTSMDFRLSHCKKQQVNVQEECEDMCGDELSSSYSLPDAGCNCEGWIDACAQDCVDNYEYPEGEETDCPKDEKRFFSEGPKKEELTKSEAVAATPSQKKLSEYAKKR